MMDKKIISFIEAERNMTLCTSVENIPHCASCFYSFYSRENILVFKSEKNTKHISNALVNDIVAGTIIPAIRRIGTIRGIQFTGRFFEPGNSFYEDLSKSYYHRYPFAIPMKGKLWGIELLEIKMTDNTLGFGKKLEWKKSIISEKVA